MTTAGDGRGSITDLAGLKTAAHTAGSACSIIFGRIRQDRQFIQQLHIGSGSAAAVRTLHAVKQTHQIHGNRAGAQQSNHQTDRSHSSIVGKPNVGKSSLLNAIAGYDRVIVTDIPGTTRDTVEETVMLGKTRLRLIDTAGIRETEDTVEAIGVERSKKAVEEADLVIFVCDGSKPLTQEDEDIMDLCTGRENAICLLNKTDLGCAVEPSDLPFMAIMKICAKTGDGLEQVAGMVDEMFENNMPCDGSILTNARQYDACRRAYEAMERSMHGLGLGLTPDAVLTDVEDAMNAMGEVTGAIVREDITNRIFERFCVGK